MKWELKNYDDDYLKFKSEEFHENELITRLLLNRSIISKKEVENFKNNGINKEDWERSNLILVSEVGVFRDQKKSDVNVSLAESDVEGGLAVLQEQKLTREMKSNEDYV